MPEDKPCNYACLRGPYALLDSPIPSPPRPVRDHFPLGQFLPLPWPCQRSIETVMILYSIPPCGRREVQTAIPLSFEWVAREETATKSLAFWCKGSVSVKNAYSLNHAVKT